MALKTGGRKSSDDPYDDKRQLLGRSKERRTDLQQLPIDKAAIKKTSGVSKGIHKYMIRELTNMERGPNTYEVILGAANLIRKGPREPIAMALKRCKGQQEVVRIFTEYEKTGLVPPGSLDDIPPRPFTIY